MKNVLMILKLSLLMMVIGVACKTPGSRLAEDEGSVVACNSAKEAIARDKAFGMLFVLLNMTNKDIGHVSTATGAAVYHKASTVDNFTGNPLNEDAARKKLQGFLDGQGYQANGKMGKGGFTRNVAITDATCFRRCESS